MSRHRDPQSKLILVLGAFLACYYHAEIVDAGAKAIAHVPWHRIAERAHAGFDALTAPPERRSLDVDEQLQPQQEFAPPFEPEFDRQFHTPVSRRMPQQSVCHTPEMIEEGPGEYVVVVYEGW